MTMPTESPQPPIQGEGDAVPHAALAAQGIHTVLLQFTDVIGTPKGKLVPLDQLSTVLTTGAGFAGPSIVGTGLPRGGPRSEFYVRADLATLVPLSWRPGYAAVIGSGFVAGQAAAVCPRQVLRRQTTRLAARGWTLHTGIEPEFVLLDAAAAAEGRALPFDPRDALDKPSYDLKSLWRQAGFLHDLHQALEAAGIQVLQIDHEDARGQYEVNFAFDDALASADHLAFFRLAARDLAERHGALFSTMPKPYADQPGNGLHFHVSMAERGGAPGSAFAPSAEQATSELPLSALGRQFVAGVLAHSAALCALAAPTVNSYKRLVVTPSRSGTSWAPATVTHGPNNRTALVRTLPGRFEWRLPDASANAYLVSAALIAAGLDGIDRALEPEPARLDDVFDAGRPAPALPGSLALALDALQADAVIGAALGADLLDGWLRLKREECTDYARMVSGWEVQRYADR